jgi:hypothetical protein
VVLRRKLSVLLAAAMMVGMMVSSALPALATHGGQHQGGMSLACSPTGEPSRLNLDEDPQPEAVFLPAKGQCLPD